ncbi:GNAT family N-acetyltransferase [Thalassotalea atypica]|uniref:GNAT family N-acetyltransferase n=1 Tax=Thalassotalea atypica TaxID=2054316 RepID=UPI00257487B4|nr:GNAT family N-acetyltransferase [Thalassotalea atypica]
MTIYEFLKKLYLNLLRSKHRSLVVLDGDLLWAQQNIQEFLDKTTLNSSDNGTQNRLLTYSELATVSGDVNRKTYTHHLGTENQFLLFVDPELNVDALAALAGTIAAGGICFVWLNSQDSSFVPTHFLSRFLQYIKQSERNYYVSEQGNVQLIKTEEHLNNGRSFSQQIKPSYEVISEQTNAVQLICSAIKSKKKDPVVLTADRGRGKTTALALVCAQLFISSTRPIQMVITAPNRAALTIFYSHLERQLRLLNQSLNHNINQHQGKLTIGKNSITYLPVDQLIKQSPDIDILLVDEAAGVPVYLLKRMLELAPTCVFSSTVHGYEGAGRGFTLKFLPLLKAHKPNFQSLHLHQPVRWAEKDPLESLLFDTCLLNAQLSNISADVEAQSAISASAEFVPLSQAQLLQDETLLKQVFSVLVTAHYQTKPSDLKMLLDNPQVRIFALRSPEHQILAVALTLREGGVEPALVDAIKQGKRRLKNHFLPQSILTQCVNKQAFDYQYLRIMRIAVHPSIQQIGLGSHLLTSIENWAKRNEIDCLGTSFAANPEVCNFWFDNGYQITRIGFSTDASSGEHSAMMLKSVNNKATNFVESLNATFYNSFSYLLTDEYQQLSVPLVQLILAKNSRSNLLTDDAHDKIIAFANKEAQYSCIVFELHQWLLTLIVSMHSSDESLYPLIARILMKHSVAKVCQQYGFTGKKALNQYLVKTVSSKLTTG